MANRLPLTPEQIAASRAEYEKLKELIDNLAVTQKSLDSFGRLAAALEKATESINEQETNIRRHTAALATATAGSDEYNAIQASLVQQNKALKDSYADLDDALDKQEDALKRSAKASELYTEALTHKTAALAGDVAAMAEYKRLLQESTEALSEFHDEQKVGAEMGESFMDSVLGLSGGLDKLNKVLSMSAGDWDGFATSLLNAADSGALQAGMMLKMVDLGAQFAKYQLDFALAQDEAISNFRAATGAGKEYNEEIRNTERRLYEMGVTTADVANATQVFKNTMVDFTYLSDSARDSVRDQALMLEKLGMSQQTSAQISQIASQSMNMGWKESNQLLLDITSTARTLGVDVDKMGQEFVANKEFIVGFGKDGAQVFEELAVQAKSLGMELGTLTGVVDKFTTFDQAGQSVGRLNAILGGPFLNSIDMLNASMEDPAEAIKMLRDATDQAGVSLEDMGRAQKMAMADALGMSIEDMTNMMGKSNEELEINRINQEDLAEQARETQKITEQLTSAFKAFYIQMGPVIEERIVPFIKTLADVGKGIAEFIQAGGPLKAFFTFFGALLLGSIGMTFGMAYALNALTAAIPIIGPGLAALQRSAMKPIIVKSLAAIAIGAGAGLAGGVLGNLLGGALGGGGTPAVPKEKKRSESGFADGGVVGTTTAIVGERGPEMVEMPIGSRVNTAPTTLELTKAIKELSNKLSRMGGTGAVAVYIGDKEVTDVVLKAIDSPKGKRMFGTYAR